MNQEDPTQHLLRKLRQVFKDGYRPARGNESYDVMLNNGAKAYIMVNCLGHIFNLRNQQFNDYQIMPYKMYGTFDGIGFNKHKKAAKRMLDFIKETGLKVEECDPNKTITDFKSWKIALYFEDSEYRKDFHYLLAETPQLWSSKVGYRPFVEHIYTTTPPSIYRNQIDNDTTPYEFYAAYKITNPNASESNCYVKGHYIQERSI